MTIAQRQPPSPPPSNPAPAPARRSWLSRLQQESTVEAASPSKPPADMTDLWVMSTVDQKAPHDLSGSADLLDALVQEHLERDREPAPAGKAAPAGEPTAANEPPLREYDSIVDPPAEAAAPPGAEMSSQDRTGMLQREIDMLLRDPAPAEPTPTATLEPAPAPAAERPQHESAPESIPDLGPAPSADHMPTQPAELTETAAALAAASADDAPSVTAPPLETPRVTAPLAAAALATETPTMPAESATLQGISHTPLAAEPTAPAVAKAAAELSPIATSPALAAEAEKSVTREELDVLLAQESHTANPAESANNPANTGPLTDNETQQILTEAEGVLADELSKLMAETQAPAEAPAAPRTLPDQTAEPQADAALADELAKLMAQPLTASQSTHAAEPPAVPAAEAAAVATTAADASAATPTQAIQPPPGVPAEPIIEHYRPTILDRAKAVAGSLMLTAGQLIDIPFNFLDDLSRNILGVTAFLLLVGGGILWALAHYSFFGG